MSSYGTGCATCIQPAAPGQCFTDVQVQHTQVAGGPPETSREFSQML